jgi:hypothetical protein
MTVAPASPRVRNWGAVLLVIVAAVLLVLTGLNDLGFALAGAFGNGVTLSLDALNYLLAPLALAIATIPLALGTRRLAAVPGSSIVGRILFLAWGVLTAVTQIAYLATLSDNFTQVSEAQDVREWIEVVVVIAGVIAAVFVARGRVARGFARASLFVAIALFALTEYLFATQSFGDFSLSGSFDLRGFVTLYLWDLPRLVGLLVLGISYWRTGTQLPEHATRVTDEPKSLAE